MLPNFAILRDGPDSAAMMLGTAMVSLLTRHEDSIARNLATTLGARQVAWVVDDTTNPIDFAAWTEGRTLYIFCRGTENFSQILGYVNSPYPGRNQILDCYQMRWITPHYDFVVRQLERRQILFANYSRIVMCGHSLGGAFCHFLSRMLRGTGFGGELVVLTFGEPKCLSRLDSFGSTSHARVIAVLETDVVGWLPDFITGLPPFWIVFPVPGVSLLTRLGVLFGETRNFLSVTPVHEGTPFYFFRNGRRAESNPGAAGEFAYNSAIPGLGTGLELVNLHAVETSYLPMSLAFYTNSRRRDFPAIANVARQLLNPLPNVTPIQERQDTSPMLTQQLIRVLLYQVRTFADWRMLSVAARDSIINLLRGPSTPSTVNELYEAFLASITRPGVMVNGITTQDQGVFYTLLYPYLEGGLPTAASTFVGPPASMVNPFNELTVNPEMPSDISGGDWTPDLSASAQMGLPAPSFQDVPQSARQPLPPQQQPVNPFIPVRRTPVLPQ